MTRFHNVSERFRRGPELAVLSLLKQSPFCCGTTVRMQRHRSVRIERTLASTLPLATLSFVCIQSFQY
jgi:hypothetical protein